MKHQKELFASRLPKDQFLFYLFIWSSEAGGKELYFLKSDLLIPSKCIIKLRSAVTNCFASADAASKSKGFHFHLRKLTFEVKVILLSFHAVFSSTKFKIPLY